MARRLGWLGLAAGSLVVCVSCGAQITTPVASTGVAVTAPSFCASSKYGKPCTSPAALPTPSSIPVLTVDEVAFSDPSNGWAVGTDCIDSTHTCLALADSTADGGRTWGPKIQLGGQFPEESSGNSYAATLHIRSQGANVWVSGPGIFESHDSGRTWVRDFTDSVVALEPSGSTVWAIGGCTTADPQASCVLLTSHVGTDAWTRAAVQPAFSGGAGGADWKPVLERAPNGVAFIASGGPFPADQVDMFATRDDGLSWGPLPLPCTIGIVSLRSPDGTNVWALCGGGGGAGTGPKAVYVSTNGGRSWQERANDVASPAVGSIPGGGYAMSLAVTGPASALIGSSRAGVIRSTDGGRTWRDVGSGSACLLQGNGVSELWFVSSTTGWALEENDDGGAQCPLLVGTTDGGTTWTAEGAPLGWAAN